MKVTGASSFGGVISVTNSTANVSTFSGSAINARLVVNNSTTTPNVGFSLSANNVIKWSLASYGATSDFTFYNEAIGDSIFIKGTTNNVIIGSTTDVASAIFNVTSTTKGFLPPRGTNAQMLAIVSPATGLVFYDTTNNKLNCYDGTTWQPCW
jgi:hypothetical protein